MGGQKPESRRKHDYVMSQRDGEGGFKVQIKVCILKVGDGEGWFKVQIKVCIIKVGEGRVGSRFR